MKKFFTFFLFIILISGCKTFTNKVDEASKKESQKLSKFLKKTESELKIEFGKPEMVELIDNQNRVLIFYDSKFKIKCERKFEIDKRNIVVGFSSRNCF